jgi:cobalt/nickel transport system permease protein
MNRSSRAALKLIGLIVVLIAIAVSPIPWVLITAAACLAVVVVANVRWRRMFRRFIPIVAVAAVMGIGAFWSLADSAGRRPFEAPIRAIAAGCVLVVFGELTSLTEVFLGMKTLRVPSLLTSSLALMLRSIDVIGEERKALLRSRAARGGERSSWSLEWRDRAGLVGLLLLRAVDRSERVHRAMKARGWSADPSR